MAHVSDLLEDGSTTAQTDDGRGGHRYLTAAEIFQLSQAISLKRIADALSGDSPFLTTLHHTLDTASFNHMQRMS